MAMAEAEGEIVVKIGDPEKHGEGVSAYVSYEIQTKTSMPGFEKPSFFVRRRYNDFVWLRQALEEKHPDCIVPPLPEKEQLHYLERFAEQFIDHRRQALEVFLWRLADHPVLSQSKDFHTFLEAKVWALETAKTGVQGKFGAMLKSITKEGEDFYRHKVKTTKSLDPDYEKFENMRHMVVKLEDQLAKMNEVARKLVEKRCETASELGEFGPACQLLAQSEEDLCDAFAKMGQCTDMLSTSYRHQAERDRYFVPFQLLIFCSQCLKNPVKEYILMVAAAKETLRNREAILARHLDALNVLEGHKKELEGAKTAMENPAKKSAFAGFMEKLTDEQPHIKVRKLEEKIGQDEQTILKTQEELSEFSQRVEAEVTRFNNMKLHDFHHMMLTYIRDQMDFHRRVADAWESLLPHVEKVKVSGDHSTVYRQMGDGDGAAAE